MIHNGLEKLGNTIHPNHITAIRIPLSAVVIVLHASGFPLASGLIKAITDFIDYLDGAAARASGKTTIEGAKLDAFSDKISEYSIIFYQILEFHNKIFSVGGIMTFIGGYISTKNRGGVMHHLRSMPHWIKYPEQCHEDNSMSSHMKANSLGKIKKALESLSVILALISGSHEIVQDISGTMLAVAAVIGFIGTMQRKEMAIRTNGDSMQ